VFLPAIEVFVAFVFFAFGADHLTPPEFRYSIVKTLENCVMLVGGIFSRLLFPKGSTLTPGAEKPGRDFFVTR
jgi:hypothetical protein